MWEQDECTLELYAIIDCKYSQLKMRTQNVANADYNGPGLVCFKILT